MSENNGEVNRLDGTEKSLFVNSISYLIYMKTPWKLTSQMNVHETVKCLSKINAINFNCADTFVYLSDDKKYEFIELIVDYMKHMYEQLNENLQKTGQIIPLVSMSVGNQVSKVKFRDLIRADSMRSKKLDAQESAQISCLSNELEILHKMSLIFWSWADKSSDFCHKIHELKLLKTLFAYLNNSSLVSSLLDHVRANNSYFKLALSYRAIIGTIHNLSKHKESYEAEWQHSNCFSSLLELSSKFADRFPNLDIQLLAYFPILNLFSKKTHTIEQLIDLGAILKRVVDLLKLSSTKLTLNENLERRLYKSNREHFQVLTVNSKDILWRVTELLNFLAQLADISGSKLKRDLYEHESLNVYLNRILFNGNSIEKEHVLKLVWKLSADKQLANKIMHDLDLYSYIIGLSVNTNNKDKNLLRYSNYILFTLHTNNGESGLGEARRVKRVTYSNSSVYSSRSSNLNKFYEDDEHLKI